MDKKRLICLLLVAINILCMGVLCVNATNTADNPAQTDPVASQPGTTPGVSVPYTDPVPSGSDSVGPTVPGTTVDPLVTAPTEPVSTAPTSGVTGTDVMPSQTVAYTEDLGDNGVKPQPNREYLTGDQDVATQPYEEIQVDDIVKQAEEIKLSVDKNGTGDVGFGFDKSKKSISDKKDTTFFWLSLLSWFIALGFATFAILFKPVKKARAAKVPIDGNDTKGRRYASGKADKSKSSEKDDYNDGF